MRPHFLLLSLVLPHVIANHLQDQRDGPQDTHEEEDLPGTRPRATAQRSSGRLSDLRNPPSRLAQNREKELSRHIDTFPQLHHTDCHSGVAVRMNDRCEAKGREAIMTEGQRSDVAISLTICSMSSALQPIPSECTAWTDSRGPPKARSSGKSWFWGSTEGEEDVKVSRAMCLSALHRSPQDWTAYNNYLSDALQLCHALRSQHAEETAHQLYRNATQRQLDLLDLIKAATEDAESRGTVQADLTSAQLQESQLVMSSINELVRQLQQESTNADKAVDAVRSTLNTFEASGAGIWDKVQDQAILSTEDILSQMKDGFRDVREIHLQELASSIRDISLQHSEAMSLQTQRVDEELGLSLASARTGVEAVMMGLADRLRDNELTLQQWGEIMNSAQVNLAILANDAGSLQPILRQSAEDALTIKDAQAGLALSMRESGTISESITRNLASALLEINNTLSDVHLWRNQAVAKPWLRFQPGFSIFSSPALLSSPKLSSLISPDSLKAMAYTADLSLAWLSGLLYWFVSTIVSILASLLVMVWICTSGLVASQMKRLWHIINTAVIFETDVEVASPTKEIHITPRNRLQSLAPPAYTSPERNSPILIRSNALALVMDTVDEVGGLDQVRDAMLKRSYANLRQGRGQARGQRAVSAPPV